MTETLTFQTAMTSDIPLLRQLYYEVYGNSYPLKLGSDPAEMERLIVDPDAWFAIARSGEAIIGSALARIDREVGVAKVEGVAVSPASRTSGLGKRLVGILCEQLLPGVHSIYATCRTVSVGPQKMVLANGFLPYGIMPNAATVGHPETLGLFIRHAEGVLAERPAVCGILEDLMPLVSAVEQMTGIPYLRAATVSAPDRLPQTPTAFEAIDGPEFVRRRFLDRVPEPADRFYPFHTPNLLLVSPDGALEVYLHVNRAARYATLVGAWPDHAAAGHVLETVIDSLEALDVAYAEALIPITDHARLRTYLEHGFVPSAVYPAMDGRLDYVIMSRTLEQLDFRRLEIDPCLRPYLDCYRTIWSKIYLSDEGTSR